ncbi:MAG TPA: SsrA-binding protein SmpB [Fimbriimonadales bacterium]|nr:SsrA-binding protein SmpB [Fimbriimonadales bacterium]
MPSPSDSKAKSLPVFINRRARHDYEILDSYEAGIALQGAEVKSILQGKLNFTGAYCRVVDGELWLENMDIAPYEQARAYAPPRQRPRKLLMHKQEIERLRRRIEEKGLTLIPTKVYFRNGKVKVEISLARGKKRHDKREKLIEKAARREEKL